MQLAATSYSTLFHDLCQKAGDLPANYCNGDLLLSDFASSDMREAILQFQTAMVEQRNEAELGKCNIDLAFPLKHTFAPGNYAREIFLPADSWIIGKIHKHAHINVISMGKVVVITEDGVRVFAAPYTFCSQPGTKRVVLAIEDTVWTTVHPTNETDLSKIEDDVIATSYEALAQQSLLAGE